MSEEPFRRYVCRVCGYIYDEALGDPDGGLPPGTRFEDIPDDWECPDCGVSKSDFEPLKAPDESEARPVQTQYGNGQGSFSADQVVVIGAGMAGWEVASEIRQQLPKRAVTLITQCTGDVYPKPQLSAAVAKGRAPEDLITSSGEMRADELGIRLMSRTRVLGLDRDRKRVLTPRGGVPYAHLVLAPGAHQPKPSIEGDAANDVMQVNDLASYKRLRDRVDARSPASVVILGGGLIGCEFAEDLSRGGHRVSIIDQAEGPISRILPPPVGRELASSLGRNGITVKMQCTISAISRSADDESAFEALCSDGERLRADVVISALGLRPNIKIASDAGLDVGQGIIVDDELRTSDPSVFAIGDCAEHNGKLLPYVRPLREQAPVIATQLAEARGRYDATAGTIVIKTPSMPLAVWSPEVNGSWELSQQDADGFVYEHRSGNRLTGFALAGEKTRDIAAFERLIMTG